jgi:ferredoxin
MIITEKKPFGEIIDSVKSFQKIFLVGCGECAKTCKTGGEEELALLKQELEAAGKTVVGTCIPSAPCIASQIKTEIAKNMKAVREAEAILVLACGLGVQSVKDNERFGKEILPALNTICGAVLDAQGNFFEKCSMCGECVLGLTGGICPVTLCAKGLMNGPCGGADKGKCEVDKDKDCAWVLIYKELEKKGKLKDFKEIRQPRDYKKATKPHKLMMSNDRPASV